uniref:Uncharacterized protein n=1 Tax=Leersia perrieri TaxID=77586 RepID=A0A0D9WRL7_9ORYZ
MGGGGERRAVLSWYGTKRHELWRCPSKSVEQSLWEFSTENVVVKPNKGFGIAPVRAFHPRSTIVSERLLPRDGGILPERLLLARRSLRSSGRFPKAEGMLPWSLLLPRRPSSDGILPWKLLFDKSSLIREVMLAMQGEMEPVMPLDARSMAITRRGICVLQVTPFQLQGSNDVLLHEAKTSVGPEIWDLKQRRAC